jgi:NAD(P)-dependent dehydrogenase (short-subunit alcohol dehydrogenase family)
MKGGRYIAVAVIVAGVAYYSATSNMSVAAFRTKHASANFAGRRAVVVGGTSGIGQGIAMRLAAANYAVTIVGRDETRGRQIVEEMRALTPSASTTAGAAHDFVACDASLLSNIHNFSSAYASGHSSLDVLVVTQGMATIAGRTETAEGIDKKLALHYYGRVAFITDLLPLLRAAPAPKVLSVLSAGVHSPFAGFATDPELRDTFSLKNAADAAGFYNDIAMDSLSREPGNEKITFVHAAPGFVSTRWGTEMPWAIRALLRPLQYFGKSMADCAEFMVDPIFNDELKGGYQLLSQYAAPVPKTSLHDAARESVWASTKAVLARVPAKPTSASASATAELK